MKPPFNFPRAALLAGGVVALALLFAPSAALAQDLAKVVQGVREQCNPANSGLADAGAQCCAACVNVVGLVTPKVKQYIDHAFWWRAGTVATLILGAPALAHILGYYFLEKRRRLSTLPALATPIVVGGAIWLIAGLAEEPLLAARGDVDSLRTAEIVMGKLTQIGAIPDGPSDIDCPDAVKTYATDQGGECFDRLKAGYPGAGVDFEPIAAPKPPAQEMQDRKKDLDGFLGANGTELDPNDVASYSGHRILAEDEYFARMEANRSGLLRYRWTLTLAAAGAGLVVYVLLAYVRSLRLRSQALKLLPHGGQAS